MTKLIKLYAMIVISIIIICSTWFGIGAWLRNQPSTIMYLLGTLLNLCVPVILGVIIKNYFKTKGEKKNENG